MLTNIMVYATASSYPLTTRLAKLHDYPYIFPVLDSWARFNEICGIGSSLMRDAQDVKFVRGNNAETVLFPGFSCDHLTILVK